MEEMDPVPSPRTPPPSKVLYARAFALLAVLALGLLTYWVLVPLVAPLTWALFIAFLLHPLHAWLVRKLHCRANLSALLLTIATVLILVGPLTAMGAAFVAQVGQLLQFVQQLAGGGLFPKDVTRFPILGSLLVWLEQTAGVTLEQIQEWAAQSGRVALQSLAPVGGRFFLGALNKALAFFLAMFMLFFVIRDGAQIAATLRALIPMDPADKRQLFDYLGGVIRGVVYGTGVTAIVQGILLGIAWMILGLPSPIVFGALTALTALLPVVGPPVIWAPAAVILLMQERWLAAIFLVFWGVVILLVVIDHLVRPMLVSARASVGTLTVFIGVFGGLAAFGAVGMIAGPLVLALVIALIRFTVEMRTLQAERTQAPGQAREP